jgi:hypothetical protein
LKSGDSNTSFFHKQSQQRKKKNTVSRIQTDSGQTFETLDQIKDVEVQHFEALYSQTNDEEDASATHEMI